MQSLLESNDGLRTEKQSLAFVTVLPTVMYLWGLVPVVFDLGAVVTHDSIYAGVQMWWGKALPLYRASIEQSTRAR